MESRVLEIFNPEFSCLLSFSSVPECLAFEEKGGGRSLRLTRYQIAVIAPTASIQ